MHPESRPATPAPWLHVTLLTLLLAIPSALSITRQSLWLDEAMSCWFADHAHGWDFVRFRFLVGVTDMPLFHVLLIAWVRVFGDSERALRSVNLPFAILFLGSLLRLCRRGGACAAACTWWLPALPFAVFPLLIYYVNECRPYAALLGLSAAAAVALIEHLETGSRASAWICSLMCLVAFGMHLLGLLSVLTLTLYALVTPSARTRLTSNWRPWVVPMAVSLVGYVALSLYYLHIRRIGTGLEGNGITAATPGNLASTWRNIAFCVYEAFGFAGLGPPRNDLRVHPGIHSFHGYSLYLLLGLVGCAAFTVCIAKLRRASENASRPLLICSAIGLLLLFAASKVAHFGFFGRHAMAPIAIVCCAIILALSARELSLRTRTTAIALLTLVWTCSSARLLFLYPYGKDDARTALRIATEHTLPILWNAREYDAAYYGGFDPAKLSQPLFATPLSVTTSRWRTSTQFRIISRATSDEAAAITASFPAGQYVFVKGKADAFDDTGVWDDAIARWHPTLLNHLNGFDVWLVNIPGTLPSGKSGMK